MMEKQTAVLFLYEFVQLKLTDEQQAQFEGLFQQALEMEKKQIEKAYVTGYLEDIPNPSASHYYEYMGEEYYNQTYNNEQGE